MIQPPLPAQDDKLFTKVVYPNSANTEIRTRLRLRSSVRGGRNRLDLMSITSFDRAAGTAAPVAGCFSFLLSCFSWFVSHRWALSFFTAEAISRH